MATWSLLNCKLTVITHISYLVTVHVLLIWVVNIHTIIVLSNACVEKQNVLTQSQRESYLLTYLKSPLSLALNICRIAEDCRGLHLKGSEGLPTDYSFLLCKVV